jgi:hypothetical protein
MEYFSTDKLFAQRKALNKVYATMNFVIDRVDMWNGYKITGLIFLPNPCGLGNKERGVILACPLLTINPTTSKAIRPTVW